MEPIIAYVGGDPIRQLSGRIEDWQGERLGFWERRSVWRRRGRDGGRDHYVSLHAYIEGRWYWGRMNADWGQSIRLRPCKDS